MATEETGKRQTRQVSTPGLMTRGMIQRLHDQNSPKKVQQTNLEEESYDTKIKASMTQGDAEKYGKMLGGGYGQQMWPQGQMMRVPEGQKLMAKQPNFFIPQMVPNLSHQFQPQIGQMTPQIGKLPIHPPQIPQQIPVHPGQIPHQHPIAPINPKIPQMGPMMVPGMRGVPFTSKSPQSPIMAKNMHPILSMPKPINVKNMMHAPQMARVNPKSPTYIRQHVIRSRYSKSSPSPKNMEAFLSENLGEDEKVDLGQLLRDEITKILETELDRTNDLHTDHPIEVTKEKKDKELPYKYTDIEKIVDTLIDGFKSVLEVMWSETKKHHQYSLDEYYYTLNPNSNNQNPLGSPTKEPVKGRKRGRKKSVKEELVVVRDFKSLKGLFQKRDEIEKLMESYRKMSKKSFASDYFTFSNFNTGSSYNENEEVKEEDEDLFLKKAIEYADVASNQKLLLNNVTALDFRAALSGDYLVKYLPNMFRVKLIEMVGTLHFDLGTPPPLSPKLSKQSPEQDAVLNKVYDTLQSFQNADSKSTKTTATLHTSFQPFMPCFTPFPRDDRMKDMTGKKVPIKNFNFPPGINMFPNLPQGTPGTHGPPGIQPLIPPGIPHNIPHNIPQNMSNIPMGIAGMAKNVGMTPGTPQNFNIPPGVIPPQMPMMMPKVMPPHIQNTGAQFYNK